MSHRVTRKLTRAAASSLLVLTTTAGVAGLQALAASPAIADPVDQIEVNQGSATGNQVTEEETPAPAPKKNPVEELLGGVLGGLL